VIEGIIIRIGPINPLQNEANDFQENPQIGELFQFLRRESMGIKANFRRILAIAILAFLVIVFQVSQVAAQNEADQSLSESLSSDKPGLLILSHGAPHAEWNEPVNALVDKVRKLNNEKQVFHSVEGSFLEFTQPDAATGIEKLEQAGCDRIIVVPLFIAPSSHSLFDVPAVLGLYSSPDIRAVLKEEGARIAQPNVPITVTQTLSDGDILDQFARDEVWALSQEPSEESIVLLAHGCPDHHRLVNSAVRRIGTYCGGQCMIDYVDWAFCAVGQTFLEKAYPAIIQASEAKKRVIVVGLYVSSSAQKVYERAMRRESEQIREAVEEAFEGNDIVFSNKSLVEYEVTAHWVLECAVDALISIQHAAKD
jgi:hypothetical protein